MYIPELEPFLPVSAPTHPVMPHLGIRFFGDPISRSITQAETTITALDAGIVVSIPEHSLSNEEGSVDLLVHPCFSGPFQLPYGYESASPAYLIQPSRKVKFLNSVTIQIHHHE